MTRETKIGMLVGLGVIVLIGVLLSEYLGNGGPGQQTADLGKYRGAEYRSNVERDVGMPSVKGMKPGTGEAVVDTDAQAAMAVSDGGTGTGPTVGPTVVVEPMGMIPSDHQDVGAEVVAAQPVVRVVNRVYIVQKNDTVKSLAKKFYNSAATPEVAGLVAANPGVLRDGNTPLVMGKKIMIPMLVSAGTPAGPAGIVGGPVGGGSAGGTMKLYTVVKGDTISTIAKMTLGTGGPIASGEILKANGLEEGAVIREGAVLKIPAKVH